ncbi:MAG: TrmH family RNA methyltransferase, partial [Pseudomonadota bacterium]
VASLVKVLDWLGNYGIKRVGTSDAASGTFWETSLSGPVALIMGTEERGMAPAVQERCDALVALPMAGVVESLNVSVATGICLFECVRQRSACSSS